MSDFLEKIKKGMNIPEENIDKEISLEDSAFKDISSPDEEPEIALTASKKEGALKVKKAKKSPAPKKEEKPSLFEAEGELTADVFETEKNIVIQSAVAGVDSDELDIIIEKDMVSISGRRERQFEENVESYYSKECWWGKFSKEIILPCEVDASKAEAVMKNGILTITIPKISREKNKKLNIKEIE